MLEAPLDTLMTFWLPEEDWRFYVILPSALSKPVVVVLSCKFGDVKARVRFFCPWMSVSSRTMVLLWPGIIEPTTGAGT